MEMNVEIVFTGLCSFLNVDGKNDTMGDPSVILVQTPHEHEGHDHEGHDHEGHEEEEPEGEDVAEAAAPGAIPNRPRRRPEPHIAFLAFHTDLVAVDDDSDFKPVDQAEEFVFMEIDGYELTIENDPLGGVPSVDDTYYDHVVRKDDYWKGEVQDDWNPDYVAPKGHKPNQRGVKTFMRFGAGRISAALISKVKWQFLDKSGSVMLEQNFAEEVIYSGFPHSEDAVVITLTPLPLTPDSAAFELESSSSERAEGGSRTLRFTKRSDPSKPLTLIVGNGTEKDMPPTVRRVETTEALANDHFKFLNRVAAKKHGDGPIPKAINLPPVPGALTGGRPSGICGPGTGNGGTKTTGGTQ